MQILRMRYKRLSPKQLIVGAIIPATLGVVAILGPTQSASAASGGGCGAAVTYGAYKITACDSANGIMLESGGYLTVYGPPYACEIDVAVYDTAGTWDGENYYSCTYSGYYTGPTFSAISIGATQHFRTVVYLKLDGQVVATAYSPIQNI